MSSPKEFEEKLKAVVDRVKKIDPDWGATASPTASPPSTLFATATATSAPSSNDDNKGDDTSKQNYADGGDDDSIPASTKNLKVPPKFIVTPPTKEMTGVSPFLTRLCATISADIYRNEDLTKEFNGIIDGDGGSYTAKGSGLTKPPEVLLYENNGIYDDTNPPVVVVVADQTMIIGWRGSHTIMDWVRDFGFFVGSSFRWSKVAKVVKVQGAYMSMVESFMVTNEEIIFKTIKERNITDLILTGHSLAGGVAQVGHLWIEGSMNQQFHSNSYASWEELNGTVTVRTIAFEAPMTTVYTPLQLGSADYAELSDGDKENADVNALGVEFLKRCGANMCTTCYGMDVVPRMYGQVEWGLDVIDNLISANENHPDANFLQKYAWKIAEYYLNKFIQKKEATATHMLESMVAPYVQCARSYQHIGKIIWYKDADTEPQVYIDDIPENGLCIADFHTPTTTSGIDGQSPSPPQPLPQFRTIAYIPSGNTVDEVVATISYNHLFIVFGPGLSLSWQSWFED